MSNQNTQQFSKLNLPIHRPFVHPDICQQLVSLGITASVDHHWKIKGSEALLFTNAYDLDNYYKEAEQITNLALDKLLPAYQASDIEPLLGPLYHFINTAGRHCVGLQRQRSGIGIKSADRYCDALAIILIELIKRGAISAEKINGLITQ